MDTILLDTEFSAEEFTHLNDALIELEMIEPRCVRVVELKYFAGLKEEEVAAALGVSLPTVKRDWKKARAFLSIELRR